MTWKRKNFILNNIKYISIVIYFTWPDISAYQPFYCSSMHKFIFLTVSHVRWLEAVRCIRYPQTLADFQFSKWVWKFSLLLNCLITNQSKRFVTKLRRNMILEQYITSKIQYEQLYICRVSSWDEITRWNHIELEQCRQMFSSLFNIHTKIYLLTIVNIDIYYNSEHLTLS